MSLNFNPVMEDKVTELEAVKNESTPTIWAVGGGKGGVGKSIMSSLLAFWLARLGSRTILMDLDLGGSIPANSAMTPESRSSCS